MAISIEKILIYVLGGGFVGGIYYLYQNNFFSGGGNGGGQGQCLQKGICVSGYTWSDSQCKCVPSGQGQGENPAYTGGAAFYMKRKRQCLDNHLTDSYLRSQGVKLVGYKLYNDNQLYPEMCGGPGPLTVLAAVALDDAQSGSILKDLGFSEYGGDTPLSNVAYAMVAQQGPFTAYRTERY